MKELSPSRTTGPRIEVSVPFGDWFALYSSVEGTKTTWRNRIEKDIKEIVAASRINWQTQNNGKNAGVSFPFEIGCDELRTQLKRDVERSVTKNWQQMRFAFNEAIEKLHSDAISKLFNAHPMASFLEVHAPPYYSEVDKYTKEGDNPQDIRQRQIRLTMMAEVYAERVTTVNTVIVMNRQEGSGYKVFVTELEKRTELGSDVTDAIGELMSTAIRESGKVLYEQE